MKKNQLVKFSLSVVCAAVLAACSSGGGDNGAAAAAQQKAQAEQQAAAKAAAEKAAAEKAAAEAAAKAAAEKALADAAAKAAAEKDNNRQGVKFVKKTASDFEIGLNETGKTSTSQGSQSDMTVKLHRSLDTVVVATNTANTKSTDKVGYLEDYDFRKADQATLDVARKSGETTLSHINVNSRATTARTQVAGTKLIVNGATQIEAEGIRIRNNTEDTKTQTMGTESGKALVYQTDRTNYIGKDEKVVGNNSEIIVRNDFRDRKDTVTEVYGHRTFVVGNAETGVDVQVDTAANAPFQALNGDKASGSYAAGTLSKVQYGRVTSQLDVENAGTSGVKTGIATQSNAKGTLVTQYGTYNAQGTENNYFYRGVDATAGNANLTANLAKAYGQVGNANVNAGSLTYQGHAVTYGFEHKAPAVDLPEAGRVPNAVYGKADYIKPVLVSGTHATANIDLATRNVTGSLYDVWAIGDKKVAQDIATFKGTLANSGEIDGTSARTQDNAAGSFTANLYGTKAEELGGGVASKATADKESWGAVFGAQIQNPAHTAVAPEAPKSPWSVQTDEANK